MFARDKRLEVERRLQKACDDRARAGLPPPVDMESFREIIVDEFERELEAKRPKFVPQPIIRKVAAVAPRPAPKAAVASKLPVVAPMPPAEAARRKAIIDLTPPGATVLCVRALKDGMSVIDYRSEVAAWTILSARQTVERML